MSQHNVKDIVGGGLILLFGIFVAAYALTQYPVGTPTEMGPGMFPVALGCLTSIMGLVLLIQAWGKPVEMPKFRILVPVVLALSILVFALLIRPFGLIPAVIATILVASIAELDFRPVSLIGLCVVLCLIVWLTFTVGLGLPIPVFNWPF